MKEAMWGVLIVALGLLGIVIVQTFQNVTVTNDQNYYLLKETTEAAMLDAVDLTYYRRTGTIRIVEDKFVENLTRRFAESAVANQDYDIVVHSIIETPPFVSVSIGTYVFSLKGDSFNIKNSVDAIIETKYSNGEYEDSKGDSLEFSCTVGECEIASCISGDLRFTGWSSVALPDAMCKQGAEFEDINRSANYQICESGVWKDKQETVTAEPKSGVDLTYTWTFFKDSILHDIDVETTETVDFGKCLQSFTICPSGGLTIYVGENVRLTPEYNPSDAVNKELTWESSNASVSVMGLIEAIASGKSVGNATITATSSNNKKATCKIEVISLSCPSQMLAMDPNTTEQATLINGIVPSNAIWSIDNTNYATIDSNGKITSKDTYGVYYYKVVVNGEEIECPFEIKNTQAKELIVTCDKEDMKVYEQTSCTVKSSVTGEVLTGATLACTINNKKVEPVSNSNNTIVCSPEEVGELIVTATKATYTPGSDSVIVSETGKPTLVVNCVKGGTDTTPLSTGINFNTPITCSVSGYKTADLSFVYKSYTGNPLQTITQKEKASITITSGSTKGVLVLTAKKGTQEVIKYFEVGCTPGDIIANFDITNEAWPSLPDLCPQHFDLRLEEEGGQTIQLYTITVPTIRNSAQFCGVYGNSDPSGKDYSITGLDETLTESKNYRSYFDKTINYNWPLSLATPTIYSETGKYTFYKAITFNYDEIDMNFDGTIDEDKDVIWDDKVHDYVGTAVVSKSHTFTGDYLKSTDTYCTELEEQYPLSPNQPTKPTVTLSVVNAQYYIIPEQTPEYGYFIEANISPSTAFSGVGEWKTLFNNLSVKQDQWNWKSGRVLPTGNGGGTGTILFIAYLTEEARIKYNTPYISATVNFEILKNCGDLELGFYDLYGIRSKVEDIVIREGTLKLSEDSEGNVGKWSIDNLEDKLIPVVTTLSAQKKLVILSEENYSRTIAYQRTADKCNKAITITIIRDTIAPIIKIIDNYGNEIIDKVYIKKGDSFNVDYYKVIATDDYTESDKISLKTAILQMIPVDTKGNTTTVGSYNIQYSATDESYNTGYKTITVIVTEEEVKPPMCVVSGGSDTWTNQNVLIKGTCVSQGGAECNQTIYYQYSSNTETYTGGPGINGGAGQVCDVEGNCAICEANQTVKIDKTAPTCVVSGGSLSWTNENVTITGTCSDTGGSGCSGNKVSNTFTDNFRDSVESPGTVYDKVGNSTVCGSLIVKIDKIEPKCESIGGSSLWTNSAITLTGKCTDTGSGCTKNVTRSFVLNTELYNQSPGTVYDKAGNSISCPANQTVRIDTDEPSCLTSSKYTVSGVKYMGTWTNQSVTITGTCSDTGGSGCNTSVVPTKTYSTNTNSMTENPGTVKDLAGNSTTCPNTTIKIDTTPPTCATSSKYTSSGIRYNGSWTDKDITATGVCSTDLGGSGCNYGIAATKIFNYNINSVESPGKIYDTAGNPTTCNAELIIKIDKSNPEVSVGNCPSQIILSDSRYLYALVTNSGPSQIAYEWSYENKIIATSSSINVSDSGIYTISICNELNKCDEATCLLNFKSDIR